MKVERDTTLDHVARSIWKRRPDVGHKPWPLVTAEDYRAYPHNPVAAVDLCYSYAEAAMDALGWIE